MKTLKKIEHAAFGIIFNAGCVRTAVWESFGGISFGKNICWLSFCFHFSGIEFRSLEFLRHVRSLAMVVAYFKLSQKKLIQQKQRQHFMSASGTEKSTNLL